MGKNYVEYHALYPGEKNENSCAQIDLLYCVHLYNTTSVLCFVITYAYTYLYLMRFSA
ncbi:hypothetical protein FGIG_00537 [Fasciola gigantica]|uniref:Uncharacterized protein n=1 Tax=Fasciola gigantica TaxID=46835 RepID=A0A504YV29_FASGI|nr:hypothetical protein FGIG_00537 [Fasciola gigantica]